MRYAIAVVAAVGAFASTASAADTVTDCSIQPTGTINITSARNMTCHRAARVVVDYQGSISKRFAIGHGFDCSRQSGGRLGGQWRCAKANGKAFRFDFAD